MQSDKTAGKPDRDDQIRERAYAIWLAAGQPHGEHEAHWGQAEEEIDTDPGDLPVAPENNDTVRNGIDRPAPPTGIGAMGDRGVTAPKPANGTGRR
jgi:hypothetical protein